jgi:integrase
MVFLAASTGLRVSEILGLKWGEIDFVALDIRLSRGVVDGIVGVMKTEASRKPIALDSGLADVLLNWRACSAYNQPEDWLFASPRMKGAKPYSPGRLRTVRAAERLVDLRCCFLDIGSGSFQPPPEFRARASQARMSCAGTEPHFP